MNTKKTLNNFCKFPSILGGKLNLSNTATSLNEFVDINSEDFVDKKFFFSGNSVVIEKSREITSFDMLLLLQILEFHQKYKTESVITDNELYKHSYTDEEKNKYLDYLKSYCQNEGKEAYEESLKDLETKNRFLSNVIQMKVDEDNFKKFKIYAESRESYSIAINVADLLKARRLRNQIENRKIVENSLRRLFSTDLVYYFLDEKLQIKIKDIKKNKHYKDWKDEVKECFYKNKHKSHRFYRHIIESMDVKNDASEIYVRINKGFLDFCDESKYFNFDNLIKLKSDSAKAFYLNACFSYKEILSKEYMYDLMDLKSERDCKNLEQAKKAIKELQLIDFLTKDSCYNKTTKMFNVKLTETEKIKQGLINQAKFTKAKRGKKKNVKSI